MCSGRLTCGNSTMSGSGKSGIRLGTSDTPRARVRARTSVVVRLASALAARVEGMAAPAGGGGVGVLDREAAAHQVFLVVDLGALEVAQAHGVHDDLDAFRLEDLVALGLLVEDHAVGEAGAPPALDVDAKAARGDVGLLLLQDPLDLFGRRVGEVDHPLRSYPEDTIRAPLTSI